MARRTTRESARAPRTKRNPQHTTHPKNARNAKNARRKPPKETKQERFYRIAIRLLSLLLIAGMVFCLGLYAYQTTFRYQYDDSLKSDLLSAPAVPSIQADTSITNIALFGLDARPGDERCLSDCMMIATIDNTRGKIKLISLMRDSLVLIPDCGYDKLNAAYSYGGPELAIRTINECFGTDIRDYIAVQFEQLVTIIDEMDGVELDVQENELAELNRIITDYGYEQDETFPLVEQAGLQTLNGVQAMCYGRIRKNGTGDDWMRVERQGLVLNALFEKVQNSKRVKLLQLMKTMMPYVTTSLSPSELAPLIAGMVRHGIPTLEHTRVPIDGEWWYSGDNNTYIQYDLSIAADHIHRYIYDDIFPGDPIPEDTSDDTDNPEESDAVHEWDNPDNTHNWSRASSSHDWSRSSRSHDWTRLDHSDDSDRSDDSYTEMDSDDWDDSDPLEPPLFGDAPSQSP